MAPVLLCQGFQRAFVDATSSTFSLSAASRRNTCEQLLAHARTNGWGIVHAFLETDVLAGAGASSIDGFAPLPTEPYFPQKTLSAFAAPGLLAKVDNLTGAPVLLMSFAGLGAIAATFLDGLQRRLPIHIVADAVADGGHAGVGEQQRLAAIETLGRAHGRLVTQSEARAFAATGSPFRAQLGADVAREEWFPA
jgi:nicotinamidase-related amidase